MGRDQDRSSGAGQYEWVNTWVASAKADAPAVPAPAPVKPNVPVAMPATAQRVDDQLMRDIAEIERVRDALATIPISAPLSKRRTQALTLVPSRTSDNVPVVVGGVLAVVMLTVFGAAAAMTKLSR